MVPAAELDRAGQTLCVLELVPGVLRLAEHERRIVEAKIQSVTVPQLRIPDAGAGGVAIEDRSEQRDVPVELGLEARPDRGERRRRPAARHVAAENRGPAVGRVDED